MNEKMLKKFAEIRDIPYRIPLAVEEEDYCCSGKHIKLKQFFEENGFKARYRVCSFRWSDLDLPTEVARTPHEDDSTHVFLEVMIGDSWKIIDATWDRGLSAIFHVNDWDGESDTEIAVPAIEIYDTKRSDLLMTSEDNKAVEEDLIKNGKFYGAFNNWLESVRLAGHK